MGDYAFLYLTDTALAPADTILPEGTPSLILKYHVPILWLALFEPSDLVSSLIEGEDEPWPYLVSEVGQSVGRLATRRPFLRAEFPSLKDEWIDQFVEFLSESQKPYVHLETSQIAGVIGLASEGWRVELAKMLEMFDVARSASPSAGSQGQQLRPEGPRDALLSRLGRMFGGGPKPPAKGVDTLPMPKELTGRQLYALRFEPPHDEGTSCWWYCGGEAAEKFVADS